MVQILCSTGALIGRPNNRDYTLLKPLSGVLNCDGYEFMMYSSWYDEQDRIIAFLQDNQLNTPVLHCEKNIGKGHTDFARFFDFVKKIGYQDAFTVEATAFGGDGTIDTAMLNDCLKK